jgi:hypothetical protein
MKPISPTARNGRSFPLVELNYQPMRRLSGFRAHCGKTVAPAFHSISNSYFQREARRDFVGEACFFVAIIVTIAVPLFSMVSALTELCRAIGQL